jgi:hypothetical protein
MSKKIPARKWAARAVLCAVTVSAVALGTGGAAFAGTSTTSGSTPAASRHSTCARASKALSRIDKVEAAVTKRLPKLEAAETRLTTAGHTKRAARVEKRIERLQNANVKAGARAQKIQAKCPTATAS